MRIRTIAAGFAIVSAVSGGSLANSGGWLKAPVPLGLAAANISTPDGLQPAPITESASPRLAPQRSEPVAALRPMPQLQVTVDDTSLLTVEPRQSNWSRDIESGETLDGVLAEAGLSATDRTEIALARSTI